jgi:hypothetical protein
MMKKIRSILKVAIFCLTLILIGVCSHAQVLESIQKNFQQYQDHVLQEKIFTHTDKSFYLTGEILWFKVYTVDAGTNRPMDISKVAYVDVLDNANNPVLQAKIKLTQGGGNGSFYIPVSLQNGNYKLRAYTAWMKNFSPELYFEKAITIVNPLAEPSAPAKATAGNYAIQFFPEGGNLVSGVTTTVGFKVTGTDGKGMEINGVVINQRNDTVARFQTLKFGMGSFSFTPDANNSYKAVVRVGRDNALISDLPVIATSGYAIHLTGNSQPELKISTRGTALNGQPVYLFAYCGHKVVMAQSITPGAGGDAIVPVNKEILGQGVNHFTLFNSAKQPVCERLYFNRPTDLLKLYAVAQRQYQTRKPVSVDISANDAGGKPLLANMSVSVYRVDSLTMTDEADMVSYLWLKSEIKGDIESPGYYFNVVTSETDKALDNLLLTQGWSRFKWTDVLNNTQQKFSYLPEFNGHIITGQVTNSTGGPAPDVLTYLGVIGKRVQLYGSVSDSTGRIMFNTKDMYGPGEAVVQTNTEKDSTSKITISSPFSEQYSVGSLSPFHLSNQSQKLLEANSIDMQVQNIYNAAKLKQYYNPHVDSSAFYGNLAKTYKLDDFVRFTTMEEVLREYIAEINVVKQKNRFHIKVISHNGFLDEGDPLVLLDGIPVFNIDKVVAIDPLKVKKLDMLNHVYYWGPIFADGLMSYTTYKGDLGGTEINPHAVVLDYEGMQLEREFYSPVYQTENQQKSRLPDFRNVLYWAPDVNTNNAGKANISFYTSDRPGKYITVVQGLTADGQAGSFHLNFEVNK